MITALTLVALGFFLGMRHATDADHVIAVSTIVTRQGRLRAGILIGGLWGVGHTLTIAVIGGAIILFRVVIPPAVGLTMEMTVALMLVVLGLIDVVMISNLLIMVIVGGYETFVSRLNLQGHPDEPEWLSHVNASVLKIKLAMAIIGISSIHLLRTFIEAGGLTSGKSGYTETGVMWQTIIHTVFILSAVGIAIVDKISNGSIEAAAQKEAH